MKKRNFKFLKESIDNITLEIMALKNTSIIIDVINKNLFPNVVIEGYIDEVKGGFLKALKGDKLTTEWFGVEPSISRFLVMSGNGFNCAVWQFADKNENIIETKSIALTPGQIKIVAEMPDNAVKARVFYFDASVGGVDSKNYVQIEYGCVPTKYTAHKSRQIEIPKLNKGDMIKVDNGRIILIEDGEYTIFEDEDLAADFNVLAAGDTLYYNGDCRINVIDRGREYNYEKECYGIAWRTGTKFPFAERLGGAQGLHFSYKTKDVNATPYKNDFDSIYPWSQMRLCCVQYSKSGKKEVVYAPSMEFTEQATVGNVMIEIPKFYFKHEQKEDGYEYLWISSKPRGGFKLAPLFWKDKKEIRSKVAYVGVYLNTLAGTKLFSRADAEPLLGEEHKKLAWYIKKNYVDTFRLYNDSADRTLRYLFAIETACLDSRLVLEGEKYRDIENIFLSFFENEEAMEGSRLILT